MDVAQKEKLVMPPELAARLALHSERNMRRCLLSIGGVQGAAVPVQG